MFLFSNYNLINFSFILKDRALDIIYKSVFLFKNNFQIVLFICHFKVINLCLFGDVLIWTNTVKNGLVWNIFTDTPIRNNTYEEKISFMSTDNFYVTWGAQHTSGTRSVPGQPLPPHGKPLGKLNSSDLKDVIKKVRYESWIWIGIWLWLKPFSKYLLQAFWGHEVKDLRIGETGLCLTEDSPVCQI